MTPDQAQSALRRPLKFRDPEQLKALEVMERIEEAMRRLIDCDHQYNDHQNSRYRYKLCSCLHDLNRDTLRAALQRLSYRKLGSYGQNSAEAIERCL